MKKVMLMSILGVAALAMTGCGDYFSSPERKSFDAFVAKCKANPASADCVAYKESTGGGPN